MVASAAAPAGGGGANGNTGDGQSAVLNTGRLSFDCLLNCLDGVEKGGRDLRR